MNFGEGFSIPAEEREFQFMGSWIPITPNKPIPTRSNLIQVDTQGSQIRRGNWQELAGLPNGCVNQTMNYNGGVQSFNLNAQAGQNGGYYGVDDGLAERNRLINHIAGSYTQARCNESAGWNNSPLANLLATRNAGSVISTNGTSRSISMANRPLVPSWHSQVDNWRESNLHNFLLSNQTHCSGSNLLGNTSSSSQITQHGFPIPYRANYNLNLPPRTEAEAGSSATHSFQMTPATQEHAKNLGNNQLSASLNFLRDESSSQEKEQQENFIASLGNEGMQNNCDELLQNIVDSSSSIVSASIKEKDPDKGNDLGIDLNETPQQKPPKRRKHRPKVIVEGKPKKTPNPKTPKIIESEENPRRKRKYVRKKGLQESATQPADFVEETAGPSTQIAEKSCRRVLNFDLENTSDERQGEVVSQQEDMQLRKKRASNLNLNLNSEATELYSRNNSGCGTESDVHINQQNRLPLVSQQVTPISNHIPSMKRMLTDYISIPERQAVDVVSLAPRKDLQKENYVIARNVDNANVDPSQRNSKIRYSHILENIHAEGSGRTVFQAKTSCENFERTRQQIQQMSQSTPQQVPKIMSMSIEARGSKREYHHTTEQRQPHTANPMGSSLLCQEVYQIDECHGNGSIPGAFCSERHKKKKIENGLHTNTYSVPSYVKMAQGDPHQAKSKGTSDVNANGTMSQRIHGLLSSNFESNNVARGENSGVNKSAGDWYAHSMPSWHNLPRKHTSSEPQQIPFEPHLRTRRMEDTNRSTRVNNFPSQTAIEKYNLHPSTPPNKVPTPGEKLALETCQANISEKQTVGPNLSKTGLSGKDKVLQEKEALYNYRKSSAKQKGAAVKQIYPILIDDIQHRLESLHLNERSNQPEGQEQNALVPYKGGGALVPHDGSKSIKKHKPRPKVDLDPETNRLWKLLMGKEESEGHDEIDKEKEKWWEEERRVFRGRADSFIARMHLVQGDRRFSQWKGSVVDSVIGVFLTQNVSDHLSSSAFMSLAARFPLKSSNRTCDKDGTNILVEEPEVCILDPNETIKWCEKVSSHPHYNQAAITPHESTDHQRDSETSGIWRTSVVEAHSHSLEEEVLSSQDSFDSSIIQGSGGIRSYSGSNSETEDPNTGCKPNKVHGLTNLRQMENATLFEEFYSRINGSSLLQEGPKVGPKQSEGLNRVEDLEGSFTFTQLLGLNNLQMQKPFVPSSNNRLDMTSPSKLLEVEGIEMYSEECISSWPSTASKFTKAKDADSTSRRIGQLAESMGKTTVQRDGRSQETTAVSPHALLSNHSMHQQGTQAGSHATYYHQPYCDSHQHERNKTFQFESTLVMEPVNLAEELANGQNSTMQHTTNAPKLTEKTFDVEERITVVNETATSILKVKKRKAEGEKKNAIDWDSLRKQVQPNDRKKERSKDAMDSLDYEAVRTTHVNEISSAIKERGMNNMLAERIQEFLNRIVREHGSIDLEWLRDVPPEKAKDYLLSIRGLGLKSVECVRLLTLHHLAFPVDTNVGRIAVRLGWVPLQPLPESLQLHLLELYPVLESIQKYLWPRLCKLDQRTLYELHYQMITFGKVFCTKSRPNCNACPMRAECRHFASAFASARLALPGPEEKSIMSSTVPVMAERNPAVVINPMLLPPTENYSLKEAGCETGICEPIVEEPATPEQEFTGISESDIEDTFCEDSDEIPIIDLNIEEFKTNVQTYLQKNMELQECDVSKALVALNPEAAFIPTPKLKNVSRLRTEHQVYQLPDSHPLLTGMDRREPDDPSPYLLAIWTPGETANSIQPPQQICGSQEPGKLCNENTCFSCNSIREANSQTVRGTLLIPCRTAMRGSFPLNGTYFQVNEVFADHESSLNPIDVPREWIWNLPRRIVYFGTSVSTIFKGLSTEGIQYCFWRGFVCVRGFDQKTRAPRPLKARLHYPASKLTKEKNGNKS